MTSKLNYLFCLFLAIFIGGCGGSTGTQVVTNSGPFHTHSIPQTKAKWGFIAYLNCGTSNDDSSALSKIRSFVQLASRSNNVNCAVQIKQFSRSTLGQNPESFRGTRRYLISQKNGLKLDQNLGSSYPMATKNGFRDFVRWAMKKCPAEKYYLYICSHGAGTYGFGYSTKIKINDFRDGLGDNRFEVITFDSCDMAALANAYALKDKTKYYIATENEALLKRDHIKDVLGLLHSQPDISTERLAVQAGQILSSSGQVAKNYRSVVKTSELRSLATELNALGRVLRQNIAQQDFSGFLRDIRANSKRIASFYTLYDMKEVMVNMRNHPLSNPSVVEQVQRVESVLQNAIIYNYDGSIQQRHCGLSLTLPVQNSLIALRKFDLFQDAPYWLHVK